MRNGVHTGVGVALLCAALSASAADRGSGHFRKGEVRLDVRHVIAVVVDEAGTETDTHTYIYLSDVPMDARKIAAAFHASSAAEQQLGDGSAGYVRVCINAEGDECGLYFSHNNPSASFNSSGYGTFKLDAAPAGRIAGSWVLAKPDDFFGETYAFDLRFHVAITPPPGTPLPAAAIPARPIARGSRRSRRATCRYCARWSAATTTVGASSRRTRTT